MAILDIKIPTVGESITEVTLSQWLKKDGDFVNIDEPLCEIESDKANMELPAEASGKLSIIAQAGSDMKIGDLVARIDTSAVSEKTAKTPVKEVAEVAPAQEKSVQTAQAANYATGTASPSAAKILRENEMATANIAGSGKDGRITKEDAQKAVENKVAQPAVETKKAAEPAVKPVFVNNMGERVERREKLSRMRRTIAKRLVSAKNNTAMLTTFNEVDLTEINALREKYQDRFVKKYGIKLGYMSLFAKACSKALMEMPDVNAMIDGEEIVYHDYVDISVAISTPDGLVVPPLKNVESLSLAEIEWKIKELAEKARNGKLSLDEMTGGTFTITNGGVFGSMMSTPILNEPQSAILGMHAIQQRPMAINGEVKIRPMMYLALSYDHRIIDGSTSVTYLVRVKQLLEEPVGLLLDI